LSRNKCIFLFFTFLRLNMSDRHNRVKKKDGMERVVQVNRAICF
jgi:hypothetical protein